MNYKNEKGESLSDMIGQLFAESPQPNYTFQPSHDGIDYGHLAKVIDARREVEAMRENVPFDYICN